MYRNLLDQYNEETNIDIEPEAPVKKKGGLVQARDAAPAPESKDPLELMKTWMTVIKQSGKASRDKLAKSQEELAAQTPAKTTAPVAAKEEAPAEAPTTGTSKQPMSSIFDGGEVGGEGNFRLPVYSGDEGEYHSLARTAAKDAGIPEDLFLSLVRQESGFKPGVKSKAGAIGLTQLMPGTARQLGVNPFDPVQNLKGGATYLKEQYDKFGSWSLALAAYNAGPGAVEKYGTIPPYEETQNYVRSILQ